MLLPAERFALSYTIVFDHPLIQEQSYHLKMSADNFISEIAKARTFGFMKDVMMMHSNGLALGGSLDNAVVLNETGVMNQEGLRFKDEFVRHKMLDSLGDLAMIGGPIIGHFYAHKSGHGLNSRLGKLLLNNPHCWEYVNSHDRTERYFLSKEAVFQDSWTFHRSSFSTN